MATLVDLWVGNYEKIHSSQSRRYWEQLTTKFNERTGLNCGKDQLDNKMRKLKKEYSVAKQHNSKTGRGKKTCDFYDEIDSVEGTRDVHCLPNIRDEGISGEDTSPVSTAPPSTTVSHYRPPSLPLSPPPYLQPPSPPLSPPHLRPPSRIVEQNNERAGAAHAR